MSRLRILGPSSFLFLQTFLSSGSKLNGRKVKVLFLLHGYLHKFLFICKMKWLYQNSLCYCLFSFSSLWWAASCFNLKSSFYIRKDVFFHVWMFSETVYSDLFFRIPVTIYGISVVFYLGFLILLLLPLIRFSIIFLTSSCNLADLGSANDVCFSLLLMPFLKCCNIIVHCLNIFLSIAHSFVNWSVVLELILHLFSLECSIFPHAVENWFTQNFHLFYEFSFQKHTLHIFTLLCLFHSLLWWNFCLCLLLSPLTMILFGILFVSD